MIGDSDEIRMTVIKRNNCKRNALYDRYR